jgi:membrane-bound lytic murein transglycosylase D
MKRRKYTRGIFLAILSLFAQLNFTFAQTQAQEDSLLKLREENIVDNPVFDPEVIAEELALPSNEIPVYVPDELIADRLSCLEKTIKLTYNKQIRGFVDYFTVKNRNYALVMERRKNVYFPIFEEYLRKHNMPDELKYLSIVESGLNPRAISRAGAAGLWQFMPSTGKMYHLHQDQFIDERLDPYKSTEAACQYLQELYNMFGHWQLALASYNCGPGNVRSAIRKSGYKNSFWEVYNHLPKETRSYVPQFVAVVYSMNHLKDHNIYADSLEYPIPHDTLMVKQYMNLDVLCQQLDMSKDNFLKLNPALKRNVLPEHVSYVIRIPSEKTPAFALNRAAILDSCKRPAIEIPNISLSVPISSTGSLQGKTIHVVKQGEVLGGIANRNNVSISNLRKWNNIRGNNIRSGQRLVIYKNGGARNFSSNDNIASNNRKSRSSKQKIYYVQAGDTLWTISRKNNGVSVEKIKKLNKLKGNEIKPGMKLVLS